MKTLQFLIDNICADFTVDSLLALVRKCLAGGRCSIGEIADAIKRRDRSLDTGCAEGLAEGAVAFLAEKGDVEFRGSFIYATGSTADAE